MTEVQIKHAQFKYYTEGKATNPETGETIKRLVPRIALRDQIVDIPREEDIERGEAAGAFYTEADYEDQSAESSEESSEDSDEEEDDEESSTEPPGKSHDELVAWIRDERPSASRVVAAADNDPDKARALIEAEKEASGGDPRNSVIKPLTKIAQS